MSKCVPKSPKKTIERHMEIEPGLGEIIKEVMHFMIELFRNASKVQTKLFGDGRPPEGSDLGLGLPELQIRRDNLFVKVTIEAKPEQTNTEETRVDILFDIHTRTSKETKNQDLTGYDRLMQMKFNLHQYAEEEAEATAKAA